MFAYAWVGARDYTNRDFIHWNLQIKASGRVRKGSSLFNWQVTIHKSSEETDYCFVVLSFQFAT